MEVAKQRGRPPKEVEQRLIEGMSKLSPLFLEKLEQALKEGKPYALKIYANHTLPKNAIDFNINAEKFDISNIITFVNTNPDEKDT